MMASVKNLSLMYDLPSRNGGFSEGDNIKGTFTYELKNDTKVQSIFIKAKGDAYVGLSNDSDDNPKAVHQRIFKAKVYVTPQNAKEMVIPKGIQTHHFLVTLPQTTTLPSSFECDKGMIVYTLEAKITRRLRMDSKVKVEFNFCSRSSYTIYHLMSQVGMVKKELGYFSKGQVQMNAEIERDAFAQGETVLVIANVQNSSNHQVRPKYTLKQVVVTRVKHYKQSSGKVLVKGSGDAIAPKTQKRVIFSLQIPVDIAPSIGNCKILSVEYFLKVYLDVKLTFVPEMRFPLLIVPPGVIASNPNVGGVGPYGPWAPVGPPIPSFSITLPPYNDSPPNLPQEMASYAGFPGQAANPLPEQIPQLPVAYPYALPQAAPNHPSFPECPPPYSPT